ncbi:MAG: hypothetical protein IKJ69_03310 [Clostridia bacterium]|nr:hypothetical protein [Clostridia bacterium]
MKDKKKIIICAAVAVVIVAGIIAGIFIGKRNTDKNEETESSTISTTTTTEASTTTEVSTTTTEMPTSTEKAVSVTVVDGIISNTDRKNFSDILGHILWFNFDSESVSYEDFKEHELKNFKPYDYKAASAKRFAYSSLMTGYYTLAEEISDIYNWWDFCINDGAGYNESTDAVDPDPKGVLGEYYCIVDAEYIDMALKTVFNITPDHNYVLKSKDGQVHAYYYDGDYYYRGDEGGDGAGPEIDINDIDVMNDGKYSIKATYYVNWGDDREKILDLNVVAEMKTVEGKSLWSFYKIEKA